ncbi:ABC transporter permease [Krasilnikoviella flava]|uniref:FtsX-like permease family protein n=1 Tax=Krasilnikoviella flava TaxID=526729 RepID=A0A1T5JMA7_9MICO|nr:FtsX-like permease family protein [Krasilnikoviella flava]SKC52293.1 FtsX-like permease family protein [Krasilnikoviella flava]
MSRARLLVRRAGAHRGLLVLVALLVATVAAALGTTVGTVHAAEARVIHDGLTRGGAPGVVAVTTRLAPPQDAAAQDAALRGHVDALFAPAPYDLVREEIPDDDSDDPFVRWTLTPDVAATDTADLELLASGSDALLETVLADDAVAVRGAEVTGDLGERAQDAAAATGASSAVALVPMLVLALAGVVAVAQVARLLAATRAGEVRLLVSRGASPLQLTAAAAAEAAVVLLAGALVGVGAAAAVLTAQGVPGSSLTGALAPSAGVTAAVALLVLVAVEGMQARAAAALRLADTAGRARRAATWGTVVLVLVAAGVALWLLRRYGSPLVPTPDGGQTDPAAAAAPALVLAAAAAVAVALLGPLTRAWAATAARRSGTRVLAARQVSRRLAVTAVPVVLVVVAAGSVVLASAYAGTGQGLRATTAHVAAGGDVRVVVPGASPGPAAAYEALPGAAAAAPVRVAEGTVDGVAVSTTGIPTDRIAPVARGPAGPQGVDEIAGALRGPGPYADNPRLPAGTTGLALHATGQYYVVDESVAAGVAGAPASWASLEEAAAPTPSDRARLLALEGSTIGLTLWLADPDGQLVGVDVEDLDVDLDGGPDGGTAEARPIGPDEGSVGLRADVPPAPRAADGAPGAWTVVALDTRLPGSPGRVTTLRLAVDGMDATTDDGATSAVDVGGVDWTPARDDPAADAVFDARQGTGLSLATQVEYDAMPAPFRVMVAGTGRDDLPAVLSRDLAAMLDVTTGGSTDLPLDAGPPLSVRVVDVVDVVPGSRHPEAAMVGLGELQAASLRLSTVVPGAEEMWVRAAPDAGPAGVDRLATEADQAVAQAAGREPARVTTSSGTGSVDAAGPVRQAFGVAALASVLLALVGVGAVSVATVRERRGEVAVLRAVGVPPRAQGTSRALELVVVAGAALVTGLLAGWGLAAAVAPGLAAATLTGFAVVPTAVTAFAPWAGLAPGLLLAVGLAAVVLAVRAAVTAQAREGSYREEVR